MYHIKDKRQPACARCGKPMSKWRAGDECNGKKSERKLKPDYSRGSFVEVKAPQIQACACGCGEQISRNQICFARPHVERGKQKGFTRIVSMNHYDNWFERVAHAYSKTIINRRPELKSHFR